MSGARRVGKYRDEMHERAVRMLFDHQDEYPSQSKAIESIAKKLNVNRERSRLWVRKRGATLRPLVVARPRLRGGSYGACVGAGTSHHNHRMLIADSDESAACSGP